MKLPQSFRLQAFVLFALIALLYTWDGLLPGNVLLPLDLKADLGAWKPDPTVRLPVSNRLLSDTVLAFSPWDQEIRRLLRSGEMPWQNRWAGNSPLFAYPETALFSPFTWGRLLFGHPAWGWIIFLKLLLAGIGAAWLARELGAKEGESLLSGFVFVGSGYTIVWAHYSLTAVFVFIPFLGASILRLRKEPTAFRAAAVVAFAALATAGGHPETLMLCVIGLAVLLVWQRWRSAPADQPPIRRELLAAACAALGFLLIAVQLVPFLYLLPGSVAAAARSENPVPGFRSVAVVAQVLPGFLGSPLRGELDLTAVLPRGENFNERNSGYLGAITLVLLGIAFRGLPPVFRRGLVIAGIAILVAWCVPLIVGLAAAIPVLSLVTPGRFAVLLVLFGALAIGPAVSVVAAGTPQKRWGGLLLAGGILLLAGGAFPSIPAARELIVGTARRGIAQLRTRGHLQQPPRVYEQRLRGYIEAGRVTAFRRAALPGLFWTVAAVGLLRKKNRAAWLIAGLGGELLSFGHGYLPAIRKAGVPATPPAILDLQRLDPDRHWYFAASPEVYPPNLGTDDQVRDIAYYNALGDRRYEETLARAGYDPATRSFPAASAAQHLPELASLGVRFYLSREPLSGAVRVGGAPPPAVGIYEIPNAATPPPPANPPPDGLLLGGIISILALLLTPLVLRQVSARVAEG